MQTDPIADMLNRVRTAVAVAQSSVDIPYSKFKKELAELLSREGYVGTVEETDVDGKKTLRVNLKYGPRRKPVINRSEEHTSELQSRGHLVCRLLLEKKKNPTYSTRHMCVQRHR